MNFKDLREANLSKAQINKVHDKADDLPKGDFILAFALPDDGDESSLTSTLQLAVYGNYPVSSVFCV